MKPALILSFALLIAYSCKKEVAEDYSKITGEWIWTKTTNRFNPSSYEFLQPIAADKDSTFFYFEANKTFEVNSKLNPFIRPLPASGAYAITTGDNKQSLKFTGAGREETFEMQINGSEMILTQLIDSVLHQSEFRKK